MQTLLSPSELAPSAALAADAAALRGRLAEAEFLASAIDRIEADKVAADEAVASASTTYADALAQRAMHSPAAPTDAQIRKMLTLRADAVAHREALDVASDSLGVKLATAESAVKDAPQLGAGSLALRHATAIAELFAVRARAVIQDALWPLVLEAHALERATGSRSLGNWLHGLRIEAPTGGLPIIEGDRVYRADGSCEPAREAAADLYEQFKAAGAGDMQALQAEAANYVPRAQRVARSTPYVRKGRTELVGGTA